MGRLRRPARRKGAGLHIVEEDGVRFLHIGGDAIQSAMRLDQPDRLELDYVRAMMGFLLFCPAPRDVLMVGLGGGSMARFIHQHLRRARVSVVEINPEVIAAARVYFRFPPDDARMKVTLGDGAALVGARRPSSVDVLVIDGFDDGEPAEALCTQAFYDSAYAVLRDGGVMVTNFMSDDRRLDVHLQRMERSFGRSPTMLLAEEKDNLIAFALRGAPERMAWTELRARAGAAKAYGLELERFFAPLRRRNPHTARYLSL